MLLHELGDRAVSLGGFTETVALGDDFFPSRVIVERKIGVILGGSVGLRLYRLLGLCRITLGGGRSLRLIGLLDSRFHDREKIGSFISVLGVHS